MDDEAITLGMPLLASLPAGDRRGAGLREKVESCFRELREPMYRYLRSCGAGGPQSEEMVQECFLRLYRSLHGGSQIADCRSWLFQVAHNLLIDEVRKGNVRWPERAAAEMEQDSLPHSGLDPEQRLLRRERLEYLRRGLSTLTDLQRHALQFRAEGMRYREIAAILGVSTSTVVDAVRRAVRKLGSGGETK